jgi:hypothetical protein
MTTDKRLEAKLEEITRLRAMKPSATWEETSNSVILA